MLLQRITLLKVKTNFTICQYNHSYNFLRHMKRLLAEQRPTGADAGTS